MLTQFYEYFQLYNTPQEVRSECNALTVINIGTTTAILDGLEIVPGAQYVSPGNENEINMTRYRLSFAGAGNDIVLVIRKIYK
jgi:hypothetical protein